MGVCVRVVVSCVVCGLCRGMWLCEVVSAVRGCSVWRCVVAVVCCVSVMRCVRVVCVLVCLSLCVFCVCLCWCAVVCGSFVWCVLCGVVCGCVWCGVCCGVATLKTSVCVHSTRPRVCVQNVPVCTGNMPTHTRGRVECTHGGGEERRREEGRGGSSPVLLTKMAHVGLSLDPREFHQKQPLDLTHLRFESRSRTTCHRFLQSFPFFLTQVFHSSSPEGNVLSGM